MRMAERGLVRELPRQPGQHDPRWVHLLGDVPTAPAAVAAAPAVDRDTVLAGGAEARDARVRSSYDAVATAYADHLVDELVDGSRSRPGCSTGWSRTPPAVRSSRSAAGPAT